VPDVPAAELVDPLVPEDPLVPPARARQPVTVTVPACDCVLLELELCAASVPVARATAATLTSIICVFILSSSAIARGDRSESRQQHHRQIDSRVSAAPPDRASDCRHG